MKKLISIVVLLSINIMAFGESKQDSVMIRFDEVMNNRPTYMAEKEQRIVTIKQALAINSLTPQQIYDIHAKLSEEYKKYKSDSAVSYILKNREIASKLGDRKLQDKAAIQLAWLYSTEGLYIESKELLDNIDRSGLSPELLRDYYECYSGFCTHYGQSNGDNSYYYKSEAYRDSLLMVLEPSSLDYQIAHATKLLYQGQKTKAEKALQALLKKTTDADPKRAIIAYLLGLIYSNEENIELQKRYFSISAITDVTNSIKDNAPCRAWRSPFIKQEI